MRCMDTEIEKLESELALAAREEQRALERALKLRRAGVTDDLVESAVLEVERLGARLRQLHRRLKMAALAVEA